MISNTLRYQTLGLAISLIALVFIISIASGQNQSAITDRNWNGWINASFQDEVDKACSSSDAAQNTYDIGTPILSDIWVDPTRGNDANTGSASSQALRTITEAWSRVPKGTALTGTGYRIRLQPGDYRGENMPEFWGSALGSASCPVIIQAAGGRRTSRLHGYIDLQHSRYVYLIDLDLVTDRGYGGGGNVLHVADCNHILVRGCRLSGFDGVERQPQETLKANQVQYLYVEECDISGAFWFPLDWVAVQYGEITRNKIHDAGGWAMVLKGGSAYITVEGNEIYGGVTGGFTAGQGTGFNWMVSPWLHYEASDIKFINNIIHDTGTVGLGVNGGYNILIAYNTLYNAGINDHVVEVVHGMRGCDGDPARCRANRLAGGWGTTGEGAQYIPCRNIFIYNNIIYNPTSGGYQTFVVRGSVTPPAGSNVPSPSRADVNLQIRGNIIWNGRADMPLLGDSSGCQAGNPTCYESKLRADNAISTIKPQLIDPQHGDFRPVTGGNVFRAITYTIPAFAGGDRPNPPLAPQGELRNIVSCDFNGILRNIPGVPGALSGYINRPPNVPALPAGPASGYLKTSYSYTSSSTDPDGNQIRYGFDWGDGKSSASGLINSGTAASVSHSWDRAGTYNVRVNATDSRGGKSAYSAPKSVVISAANRPPAAPAAPLGPGTGVARAFYSYSGLATDPDGDNVKYTFDWGDGKTSQTGLVRSGQRTALSHSWASPGRYSIKVRATDSKKASSVWSGARVVSISSGSHLQSPSHRQSPKMQIVIPAQGQYFEL